MAVGHCARAPLSSGESGFHSDGLFPFAVEHDHYGIAVATKVRLQTTGHADTVVMGISQLKSLDTVRCPCPTTLCQVSLIRLNSLTTTAALGWRQVAFSPIHFDSRFDFIHLTRN